MIHEWLKKTEKYSQYSSTPDLLNRRKILLFGFSDISFKMGSCKKDQVMSQSSENFKNLNAKNKSEESGLLMNRPVNSAESPRRLRRILFSHLRGEMQAEILRSCGGFQSPFERPYEAF